MRIIVDPGHGGYFKGARVFYKYERGVLAQVDLYQEDHPYWQDRSTWYRMDERVLNLDIAKRLAYMLDAGLTRTEDKTISLLERRALVRGYDLVLSIHCNASTKPDQYGVECYHWPKDEDGSRKNLCLDILEQMPDVLGPKRTYWTNPDDWRRRAHAVVGTYEPKTVLVECGYMTNRSNLSILLTSDGRQGIAEAIAQGVHKWSLRDEQ